MGRVSSVVVSLAACAAGVLAGCQLSTSGNLLRFSASPTDVGAESGSDTASSDSAGASVLSLNGGDDLPMANIPPPVVKSPQPGGTLLVGRKNLVEIGPYAGVDRISCALVRGGKQLMSMKTDIGNTHACELSDLNLDWLGDVDLVLRGRVYDEATSEEKWGPPTRQKVTITVAAPKPGPTPEWNGHYRLNASGGNFFTDDVTIRNGTLTATLKAKDNDVGDSDKSIFTFSPFQLKVDSDGTIVPQQVALNVTQRPATVSALANNYLANVKTIWVYGDATFRFGDAHSVELSFKGPKLKVADDEGRVEDLAWLDDRKYYRDDVHLESSGSSGSSASRGGGRSSSDACEKACQHTEATCHGPRGECLKARQACVKSCR